MDVTDQSKNLMKHFATTKKNVTLIRDKLKGFESHKNIGKELEFLQDYLFESKQFIEGCTRLPLAYENTMYVLKNVQVSAHVISTIMDF